MINGIVQEMVDRFNRRESKVRGLAAYDEALDESAVRLRLATESRTDSLQTLIKDPVENIAHYAAACLELREMLELERASATRTADELRSLRDRHAAAPFGSRLRLRLELNITEVVGVEERRTPNVAALEDCASRLDDTLLAKARRGLARYVEFALPILINLLRQELAHRADAARQILVGEVLSRMNGVDEVLTRVEQVVGRPVNIGRLRFAESGALAWIQRPGIEVVMPQEMAQVNAVTLEAR